ncbi:MAG TPA: VWA domain-containing protein [Pyrinomonadaceae bacterium]|nr:VWA domain-containing protein [Pyrinomonadaceae bacterium]
MKSQNLSLRVFALAIALTFLVGASLNLPVTLAQSRRQPPPTNQQQKRNQRPTQSEQQQEQTPPDIINHPQDAETITVNSALVNVDAVVINKKTHQVIPNLKQANFAIFEDGVQKPITYFSTPEAPITVALVVEFSKLSETYGYYGNGGMEPGTWEVVRPAAAFLTRFIHPPDDYASVIAYDMRPTPLTDFTNDPARLQAVISLLLRSYPAFRETNLYDALKFTLVGGRGDSVVLDNTNQRQADYAGMAALQGRRRAILLIASGIDTFSKINYGQARKITQDSGVPIYIVGTANLFLKRYDQDLSANDDLMGNPGRMTFQQAQNALGTFARETGGMYYPVTFPGEIPKALDSINTLLRNQYSLGYNPGDVRDGRQHKIVVKVDVDGDGQYDDHDYQVQSRQFYNAPKPQPNQ